MSVTLILTFYNNIRYVDFALEQVEAIHDQDFELIVTDDGSTDGTAERLRIKLAGRPRTRILAAKSNMGIASIRNWSVREATGDFVWFLDCDDAWAPQALPTMRRLIRESAADVAMIRAVRAHDGTGVGGKVLEPAPAGIYEGDDLVRLLLTGGVRGYLWSKLIRRDLLLRYPFPPRRAQEDFSVISRIVFAGARFVCLEEVLYLHIERIGSLTNSTIQSFVDLEQVTTEALEAVEASPVAKELRREAAFFEQWHLLSSVVNTSIRLGVESPSLEGRVREVRRRITWRRIACTWHFSRREGAIALAMKIFGPGYALIYRSYLGLRQLYESRHLKHQGIAGFAGVSDG